LRYEGQVLHRLDRPDDRTADRGTDSCPPLRSPTPCVPTPSSAPTRRLPVPPDLFTALQPGEGLPRRARRPVRCRSTWECP